MTLARGHLHNTVFPIPNENWLYIDFKQLYFPCRQIQLLQYKQLRWSRVY